MQTKNRIIQEKYYAEEKSKDCLYLTHREKWNWMYQDHEALLDIIDKFNVKTILELGTWQGFTAGLMLKKGVKIKAIDICAGMGVVYSHGSHKQTDKDNYGKYARGPNYELEFHDTRTYEPNGQEFDMVFIDANHDYEFVKADTELARKFNPKVIAWHDYGSEPGVGKYIDELKKEGKEIIGFDQSLIVYENTDNN